MVEAGIEQQACVGLYRFHEVEIDEIIDTVLDSKSENIDVVLKNKNVSFVANNLVELQKEIVRYYEDEYGIEINQDLRRYPIYSVLST